MSVSGSFFDELRLQSLISRWDSRLGTDNAVLLFRVRRLLASAFAVVLCALIFGSLTAVVFHNVSVALLVIWAAWVIGILIVIRGSVQWRRLVRSLRARYGLESGNTSPLTLKALFREHAFDVWVALNGGNPVAKPYGWHLE